MEKLVKGDVVVLPFPFSDLSASKKRPAVIVATLPGDDIILCQVTSIDRKDELSISLKEKDFATGKLPVESVIRPSRLFTAEKTIVVYKAGQLAKSKIKEVEQMIVKIMTH